MVQEKAIQLVIEGTDSSLKEIGLIDAELASVGKQLSNLRKEGKQTSQEYAAFTKRQTELRNQSAEVRKELKNQVKDFDVLNKNLPIDSTIALEREYRKLRDTWRKSSQEFKSSDAGKALQKQAESVSNQINISNKAIGDYTKNIGRYEEALKGLEKQLGAAQRSYKKMTDAQKASPLGQTLKQEIDLTKGAIGDLKAGFVDFSGLQGRIKNALSSFTKGLGDYAKQALVFYGVIGGIQAVFQGLKNSFNIIKEFDKAQVELQALSGQSAEELKGLTDQAKLLGQTTLFTATEVTKLQVELSKLGFTNIEIKQATEDIINFAVALDANAADAATVAASTIRAFGLDASETGRVVSVLGVAANKTALSFEDFNGNIATFAPVARAMGFSLEDSISLFGKLRDSGFEASTAATALRNIFLNLADKDGKLAKALGRPINSLEELIPALNELNASGVDLTETLELTDKRSVAAFNQLLRGANDVGKLKGELTDVNDEFKVMVDKRMNSISAKFDLLKSTWNSLVLSFDSGQGKISSNIKKLVIGFTELFRTITELNDGTVTFGDVLATIFGDDNVVKRKRQEIEFIAKEIDNTAKKISDLVASGDAAQVELGNRQLESLRQRAEKGSQNAKLILKAYEELGNTQKTAIDNAVELENQATKSIESIDELKAKLKQLERDRDSADDPDDLEGINKKIKAVKERIKELQGQVKSFAKDSIGDLEKRIAKLNETLNNTTDVNVINKTTAQVEALKESLKDLQDFIQLSGTEDGSLESIEARIAILTADLRSSDNAVERALLQADITNLELEAERIKIELERIKNKELPGLSQSQLTGFEGLLANNPFDPDKKQNKLDLFGRTPEEAAKENAESFAKEEKLRQDVIAADQKMRDALLDQQEQYNQAAGELFEDFAGVVESMFSGQEESTKETFRKLLLLTLKFAESQIRIAAEAASAQAKIAAAATLNPAIIAKVALQAIITQGLISVAFGVMRGIVQNFAEGGKALGLDELISGKERPGGKIMHGKSYKRPGSSDNVIIHGKRGEMYLNETQQRNLEALTTPSIWGDIGVPGFNASRSPLNNLIRSEGLSAADLSLSDSAIELLAETMADRVSDAIIDKNRLVERKKLSRQSRRRK